MKKHWRTIVGIMAVSVGTALLYGYVLPTLGEYGSGLHATSVRRLLSDIETEYRGPRPRNEPGMLNYVTNYYRYEDMPRERDLPAVRELAVQRNRTIAAIEEWHKKNP